MHAFLELNISVFYKKLKNGLMRPLEMKCEVKYFSTQLLNMFEKIFIFRHPITKIVKTHCCFLLGIVHKLHQIAPSAPGVEAVGYFPNLSKKIFSKNFMFLHKFDFSNVIVIETVCE